MANSKNIDLSHISAAMAELSKRSRDLKSDFESLGQTAARALTGGAVDHTSAMRPPQADTSGYTQTPGGILSKDLTKPPMAGYQEMAGSTASGAADASTPTGAPGSHESNSLLTYANVNRQPVGQNTGDLFSVLAGNKSVDSKSDSVARSIEKLTQSNDDVMKAMGRNLEQFTRQMKDTSDGLNRAILNADAARGTPDAAEADKTLEKARIASERAQEQFHISEKESREYLGGGGEGPSGWKRSMPRKMAVGGAVIGAAASAIASGYQVSQTMDQATLNAYLESDVNRGKLESGAFKRSMSSMDMTSAENMIKYRGDMLFGSDWASKNSVLGFGGTDRGMLRAAEEEGIQLRMSERAQTMGNLGIAGGAAGGALQMVGGALVAGGTMGLGAAVGGTMALQGAQSLMGVPGQIAGNYYMNENQQLQGMQDSGMASLFGKKDWNERAGDKQSAAFFNTLNRITDRLDQQQDAQLNRNKPQVMGLQRILDIEDAEKTAATLVGGYAMTKESYMDILGKAKKKQDFEIGNEILGIEQSYGAVNQSSIAKDFMGNEKASSKIGKLIRKSLDLRSPDISDKSGFFDFLDSDFLGTADVKFLNVGAKSGGAGLSNDARYGKLYNEKLTQSNIDKLRQQPSWVDTSSVSEQRYRDMAAWDKNSRMKADIAAAQKQDNYLDTVFNQLDMDPGEYIVKDAQLKSALGSGKGAPTAAAIGLSRSGLGGWEQIMGNLAGISKATGGSGPENYKKLESVMTSSIAAGFDTSRMAQKFVNTSLGLADSLKLRDVKTASENLSLAARFSSANDGSEASELGLDLASSGLQRVNELTKDSKGFMGGIKLRAASGLNDLGKTYLVESGWQQSMNDIGQLKDAAASGNLNDIKSPLLRKSIEFARDEGSSIQEAIQKQIKARQQSSREQMIAGSSGAWKKKTGKTMDQWLIDNMSTKSTTADWAKFSRLAFNIGAPTSYGPVGYNAMALTRANEMGLISDKKLKASLGSRVKSGGNVFTNQGTINMRRALDAMAGKAGSDARENLDQSMSYSVRKALIGSRVKDSEGNYVKIGSKTGPGVLGIDDIGKEGGPQITRMDAMQSMEAKMVHQAKGQMVIIGNAQSLADKIAIANSAMKNFVPLSKKNVPPAKDDI